MTLIGIDCSCSVSVSVSELLEEIVLDREAFFLTVLTPLAEVSVGDEVSDEESDDDSDDEERDFLKLDDFLTDFFSITREVSGSVSELVFDVKSKLSVRSVSNDLLSEEDVTELSNLVSGLENSSILAFEWDFMTFLMDLSMERLLLSVSSFSSSLLFFFELLFFLDFDMNVFLNEFLFKISHSFLQLVSNYSSTV